MERCYRCTLNNGAKSDPLCVSVYYTALQALLSEGLVVHLYELWQLCKDPTHEIFSPVVAADLKKRGLIQGGRPKEELRNVVLSSVEEGLGGDLVLVNPIKETTEYTPPTMDCVLGEACKED